MKNIRSAISVSLRNSFYYEAEIEPIHRLVKFRDMHRGMQAMAMRDAMDVRKMSREVFYILTGIESGGVQ